MFSEYLIILGVGIFGVLLVTQSGIVLYYYLENGHRELKSKTSLSRQIKMEFCFFDQFKANVSIFLKPIIFFAVQTNGLVSKIKESFSNFIETTPIDHSNYLHELKE